VSAGTGPGPGDDALPEGFTVPDDLSGLLDEAARPAGTPSSGAPATPAPHDDAPAAGSPDEGPALGTAPSDPAPPAPAGSSPAAPDAATDVPDDLSSLTAPPAEDPSVTLVLTQVAAAAPLAAACALAGVQVDVVPSHVGAIAVLRDARSGADAATAISKLLKTVPVILLERRSGQITATRWAGGQQGDELPAGLVLSDAPPVLEDLLLGSAQIGDVEGVVTSVGLSRWKAMRLLAQSARGSRG
jgi:hypothetical protein